MAPLRSTLTRARELLDRVHPANLLYQTYEGRLIAELDRSRLPRHIAVMADGNRRWAKLNAPGEPLVAGYRAGAAKLHEFAGWCDEVHIPTITLWVLSTDNLTGRPAAEIQPLLLVIRDLARGLATTRRWRIQCIGDIGGLAEDVAADLRAVEAATAGIDGMHINIAVNYGGYDELRDAVRSLLRDAARDGRSLDEVARTLEIDDIAAHLYTKGQPDPDLIIRTSGEQRLSGFLTWQSAKSEFYFCEALWPDFRKVDFVRALRSFSQRERRYGH